MEDLARSIRGSGILSRMVLKVAAGVPLVWRSPSSLQFGVDDPIVVLDGVDDGTERLIAALVSGISPSGFDMMVRGAGLAIERAAELLARLEPVLEHETPAATAQLRVAVSGDGSLADELRQVLRDEGVLAAPSENSTDLAVIVAGWVIAPEDHGSWLRRDIPHLPVVIGDGGVTVGPLIEPGAGPCLYCVQLARTDDDAAWPAIATQLWNRPAPVLSRLAVAEAAAFVARRVLDRVRLGVVVSTGSTTKRTGSATEAAGSATEATSWRLTAGGTISSRVWKRHAACRCAAPEESDWAPAAGRATPAATRRAAAAAVPA